MLGITRDARAQKIASFGLNACYASEDRAACLAQTEVLVLCVRLNAQTLGLLDASTLSMLPHGAYLVNAARGALAEYGALYEALSNGALAGAALDVFWQEPVRPDEALLSLPNVIATPHIGGVTEESCRELADSVAANIERLRRGEPLQNRSA